MELVSSIKIIFAAILIGGPLIILAVTAFLRAILTRRWLWPISVGGIVAGMLLYIGIGIFAAVFAYSRGYADPAKVDELRALGGSLVSIWTLPAVFLIGGLVGLFVWVVYCIVMKIKNR